MMTHTLKTWPEYFEVIRSGRKPFEIRRDDRPFEVGDILKLVEYVPTAEERGGHPTAEERGGHAGQVSQNGELTGSFHEVVVSYVTRDPRWCKTGFCVLGLVPFAKGFV